MVSRAVSLLRRLGRHEGGNVTVILALSSVPLILLVGASIDYTRALTRKSSLQQATDATVLAVAHNLTQNLTPAQLATQTQSYFAAAVSDKNAWIASGPTVSPDNTQVCMTSRTNVPTTIMSAAAGMGMTATRNVVVAATSCSKINNITYEIAMVLDNSGSMLESTSGTTKIASLQTAAAQMVNIMNPAGQVPKATFSLVPFSLAVNVGAQYRGASWLDNTGTSTIAMQNYRLPKGLPVTAFAPTNRFALLDAMGQGWGGCVEERTGNYLTSDDAAVQGTPDTLFEPYLYPDEYSTTSNQQLVSRYGYSLSNTYLSNQTTGACSVSPLYSQADSKISSNWPALLIDDGNPALPRGDTQTMVCKYKNLTSFSPSYWSGYNSGFTTGPNLLCDSQALTTLTNNNTSLLAQINAMYAKGSTNLISGVMWGWRTISPNGPFNTQITAKGVIGPQNAQAYNAQNNVKVMVLMTDGYNSWNSSSGYSAYENNASTYSPFGYFEDARLGTTNSGNWRANMDTATQQACTNAKAAGIQIYTVGFSIPSDPIDSDGLALLQGCATQTSMAYIAQDGSGLIAAFNSIAQSMSGLRLVN